MKLSIYAVLVVATVCSGAALDDKELPKAGDLRSFTGYGGAAQTGAQYEFLDNTPDLNTLGLDNYIVSSCSTGLWFLYSDANYGGTRCDVAGIDNCLTLSTDCQSVTSSVRYAGSPNGLDDNYFNFYDGEFYIGEAYGGNTDLASLDVFDARASSIVVSGQSEWTLYTGASYTGATVCVAPLAHITSADGTLVLNFVAYSTMGEIGLADNSIRSISRGCATSTRVARAGPMTSFNVDGVHINE